MFIYLNHIKMAIFENKMIDRITIIKVILLAVCICATSGAPKKRDFETKNSKILMILAFGSRSHLNCFAPLAQALADRGHEITILSALPPKFNHNNMITEINHGIEIMDSKGMFETMKSDSKGGLEYFQYILPKLAREMYDVPAVKELYENKGQFNLIIIDQLFNEFAFPFLNGSTFAFLSTAGIVAQSSVALGNSLHPAYVPTMISTDGPPYSMLGRWKNAVEHMVLFLWWRHWGIMPAIQKEITTRFPSLPPLTEIDQNVSIVLSNSHFSINPVLPLLPSQVEVGGMHCRPGKALPKDLGDWIEGSGSAGVVYFSLGTIAEGKTMSTEHTAMFLSAFARIPQRVIWKFEDDLPSIPSNVINRKWLPQQDILAHPKVKVFITHGGLLSTQESLYHGKPLLALPIFGDQPKNAKSMEERGFGKMLLWEELTIDTIVDTVREVIDNSIYTDTVKSVSESFRDQPMSPLDKAVWWTEYVIRYKGAPKLTSQGRHLSWIAYLYLDLIVAVHVVLLALAWMIKKITRSLSKKNPQKNSYIQYTQDKKSKTA